MEGTGEHAHRGELGWVGVGGEPGGPGKTSYPKRHSWPLGYVAAR